MKDCYARGEKCSRQGGNGTALSEKGSRLGCLGHVFSLAPGLRPCLTCTTFALTLHCLIFPAMLASSSEKTDRPSPCMAWRESLKRNQCLGPSPHQVHCGCQAVMEL